MIRGQFDIVLAVFIALCLCLGGASAAGLLANFLLQILAIALIAFSIVATRGTRTIKPDRLLGWTASVFLLVSLLQFVPLPAAIWTNLPGREMIASGYGMLGLDLSWQPISLSVYDSLASLVWLAPALAVAFFASRLLGLRMEIITAVVCVIALASIPLAGMQVISGGANSWYLYTRSGFGQGAGFFANGNHQATFLLIAIPMLSALFATQRARLKAGLGTLRLSYCVILLLLVIGVALTGSMAGVGLLLVVFPASLLLVSKSIRLPSKPILAVGGLISLASVLILTNIGIAQTGSALAPDGPISRPAISALTLKAAWDFFPTGSGIGTFDDIYRMVEDRTAVTTTFINHAHNDYAEIALETGIFGIAAILLFLVWFCRRTLALWTTDRENYFALAATIAIGVVLVHSVVDYPLRTVAISALFALSVVLIQRPKEMWSTKRRPRENRDAKSKISL